jgi:type II secretory pathway pseudopilin PulG
MALIGIVSALAAPRLISFFRGQALSQESRRILALAHYAQSRAVAEGAPVIVWFDPATSTYGQRLQAGFAAADTRATTYALESSLRFELPAAGPPPDSEQGDERLGLPAGLPIIRYTPDGFYDPASLTRLLLRQGDEAALQIAPTANRLDYEILPAPLH